MCSVIYCRNCRNKDSCKSKSLFSFPKDPERCKKWVQFCRREFQKHVSFSHLNKNYRICSDHFDDSQFTNPSNRNRLIWNAVPTLFVDVPNPPPRVRRKRPTSTNSKRKRRVETECYVVTPASMAASAPLIENQEALVIILIERKVYTLWQQIKGDCFLSDTKTASLLLNFYAQNREAPTSCCRCRCPLIHVCTNQEENVDMTLKKPVEVKEEDFDQPDLSPSCEQRPKQLGSVTQVSHSAVDTFIKLEPQCDQTTESVERAVKTQEEILKEIMSDDQTGPKSWKSIQLSGDVYRKWCETKGQLLLKDHNQLATFLIRIFKEEARPGCMKCASPLWHLCASCLQRPVEDGHGENDDKNNLASLLGHQPLPAVTKPDPYSAESKEWKQSSLKQLHSLAGRDNEAQTECITGKRKKKYYCKYCPKVFLSLDKLRVHRKGVHVAEYERKRVYKCLRCHQRFTSKTEKMNHCKENHCKEKHWTLCDRCGLMMTSSLSVHMRLHMQEKPHECNVCQRAFTQSSALMKHKWTHTQPKIPNHKCNTCGKMFCYLYTLQKHQIVHSGVKPYPCVTCGRAFSIKGNLERHRLVHTGEKPYVCDVCGARFSQSSYVQIHKRVHTGEKPYVCDICGARFSQSFYVQIHKRVHTGEKPYMCDICGARFSQSYSVQIHKKLHSDSPRRLRHKRCGMKM